MILSNYSVMKKAFLIFLLAVAAYSCSQPAARADQSREMFNSRGLRVITSFANRKQQTMSVLYGNAAARKSALSGYQTTVPGEIFTLVVYKQADNKYWYGSYINGAVQSVETVESPAANAENNVPGYRLEQGKAPRDSTGQVMSATDRTSYILSHQPSVFP